MEYALFRSQALRANDCWSADFVSDKLADGRSFRILTVIDQFTRECVWLEADRSMSGPKVVAALTRAINKRRAAPGSYGRGILLILSAALFPNATEPNSPLLCLAKPRLARSLFSNAVSQQPYRTPPLPVQLVAGIIELAEPCNSKPACLNPSKV